MVRRTLYTELLQSEGLLSEFFNRSNVGLAVFDRKLRYEALNPRLAASHHTSVEFHLGKHIREILGEVALQVEPPIQRVFASGTPIVNFDVAGPLPTRPDGGHWIDNFFPIIDSNGRVNEVGVVVVELPKNIQLQPLETQASSATSVLRSWKDIAHYVGTCVKTVQRWEDAHEFPIHRVRPSKGSVVFALPKEVDDWLRTRCLDPHRTGRR